ncbi:type VI secretion system-associated FHA domain protein [Hyalangium versicolor]|uniref:type VI secretion system-associated FHA domain protein n=1 Tax=Hyalangium versicolor TaxID=2861190 RepID=UPI001CCBE612|nr:type VI secretion system-associated FHA domain protein [Hyalangium versicolor]
MLPLVIRIKDVESKPPMEKQYVFTTSPVRIGRNQLNDISISRPFVSLFHALVRFDKGSISIVDLGSTNGVIVGGKRIEKNVPARVVPGMEVSIGSVHFEFSRDSKAVKDNGGRLTQFRALADIMSEGTGKGEALSFKPTPVQDRKLEQRTSLLPSLDSLLEQEEEVTNRSPRTIISQAIPDGDGDTADGSEEATSLDLRTVREDEAPGPKKPAPIPPPALVRKKTVGSIPVLLPQAPGGAAALQSTIQQLVPLYNAYRTSWKMLHQGLARGVDTLPEQDRGQLIAQLQRRMPEMAQEPMFQEIAKNVGRPVQVEPLTGGAAPAGGPGNRVDVVAREQLNRFVRSYLSDNRGLQSEEDIGRFLEHLADVLETFGKAFIELRQGHDQFGQQMAVPVTNDQNPLTRMRSTREILRYLLDFRVPEGASRVQELMGGFVDVMIHQIALLNGMREGVKGLLQRLSPEFLSRGVSGIWPFNLSKQWDKYTEQHRAFLEEERELTAVLFGPEFAKAYLAIVGDAAKGGAGEGDDSDAGESEEES